MNGYAVPHMPAPGYGMPPPGPPGGSPDMPLHPALLSLVASHMQQQAPQAQSEYHTCDGGVGAWFCMPREAAPSC